MATKTARGVKRSCQSCDERFYDLEKAPILCPHCGAKYVIASSPAALAALQAEQREALIKKAKKPVVVEEADSELPAVEGEEALADVEAAETTGEDDETFLEEEEEEGSVGAIIGGHAEGGEEEP